MAYDNDSDKVAVLSHVHIFASLPPATLYALAQTVDWQEFYNEETIFSVGEEADGLYVVANGELAVSKPRGQIAILNKYDIFGEIGVLSDQKRSATVTGLTDGMLLFVDHQHFHQLVIEYPKVLYAVVKLLISYVKAE